MCKEKEVWVGVSEMDVWVSEGVGVEIGVCV